MPSAFSRLLLFLSSYAPLLAILAIRNWDQRLIAFPLVGLALISIAWILGFLRVARGFAPVTVEVARSSSRDADVVSYIVSYILPFLAIDVAKLEDVLSLSVLLAVIALLYVHSNLIYVNPVLAALGYHLTELEENNGKVTTLISHQRYIRPGERLKVVPVGDFISLEPKLE